MRVLLVWVMGAVLTGCASGPQYSCPAPEHGVCKSISGVYKDRGGQTTAAASTGTGAGATTPAADGATATQVAPRGFPIPLKSGEPLRREARVIRLWVAPWVDPKSGDYYDQSYLYTEVDRGEWLIKERLRALQPGFASQPPTGGVSHD